MPSPDRIKNIVFALSSLTNSTNRNLKIPVIRRLIPLPALCGLANGSQAGAAGRPKPSS
jgi:hypothetical protein